MGLSIQRRHLSADALSDRVHPVLDRVYRGRNISSPVELENSAKQLCHYKALRGCEQAAELIADAVVKQRAVCIIGDFDADGATSTAICVLSLAKMGLTSVSYLVPNRFDFGYGLSPQIVDLAKEQGAEVIITVDNGIACNEGVARAKALGITVIVTDHHLPGKELPIADVIVNPNQPECEFPSKNLAGVGVAFYVMLAVRAQLQQNGWFSTQSIAVPNLAELLDIVAVGTVADVVPLDHNNRILVYQGLQRIRSGKCQPGITALIEIAQRQAKELTATDLGFVIGPRLNAAGRLEDMALGIECLLTSDSMTAREIAAELDSLNQQRRHIEGDMKAQAEQVIANLPIDDNHQPAAYVLYQSSFHQGVIGILAGRIKEKYKRPVIAFAEQDDLVIKGSARSIAGIHIRDVLEEVSTANPGLIDKFGGHAMAAGLTIQKANLAAFETAFIAVVEKYLALLGDQHSILTDGALHPEDIALSLAQQIRMAGPFGQGFEAPLFDGVFALVSQKIVGQNHLKMALVVPDSGEEVDAIAFNVDTTVWPNTQVKYIEVAYRLDVNFFRGRQTVQLLVEALAPYETNENRSVIKKA
jgi:single-stranded-DNA-specific exonuclease